MMSFFPSLEGFEPTRQTLHLYANAMGVIPRAHATPHPKWWHISLRVTSNGLKTNSFALPSGEKAWLEMDLLHHLVSLQTSYGGTQAFCMQDGMTGTEFGDQLLAAAANLGLEGDYAREKFENDDPREYDVVKAKNFSIALRKANHVFQAHRARIPGNMGPIQLWPHGFDLAFEWFGTRVERYEEHGEVQEFPSQLNLGFYPGGEPYFYSNPWPFEGEQLLHHDLPQGASWHTEGWEGTLFPYSELVNVENAEARLLEYAKIVFDLSAPTLLA